MKKIIFFLTLSLFVIIANAQDPDRDADGVSDKYDECPTEKGTKANKGCPEISNTDNKTQETYEIVEQGDIYSTIATTDCMDWNWAKGDEKKYSQRENWGSFSPKNGDKGVKVHQTMHCNGSTKLIVLKIKKYYVVVAEAATKKVSGNIEEMATTKTTNTLAAPYNKLTEDFFEKLLSFKQYAEQLTYLENTFLSVTVNNQWGFIFCKDEDNGNGFSLSFPKNGEVETTFRDNILVEYFKTKYQNKLKKENIEVDEKVFEAQSFEKGNFKYSLYNNGRKFGNIITIKLKND